MNTLILTRQPILRVVLLASLLAVPPAYAGEGVLFVDDDALANGDGQSWDTAYRFVQDALVFASDPANGVSENYVVQGTYHLTAMKPTLTAHQPR